MIDFLVRILINGAALIITAKLIPDWVHLPFGAFGPDWLKIAALALNSLEWIVDMPPTLNADAIVGAIIGSIILSIVSTILGFADFGRKVAGLR